MRKKLMVGLMSAAILLSAAPTAGAAAGGVTIEAIGSKTAGASIVVKGIPASGDIIVQVFRPNQSLMLTDILGAAEYEAGKTYTLPADAPAGTYSVIAGNGPVTAKTTFQVTEAGGSNSGGSSTPSSGSVPQPSSSDAAGKPKRLTAEEVAKQLVNSPKGGKLLRAEAGEAGIQFPAAAIQSAGGFQVEVRQGDVQVGIPQAVLAQLSRLVSGEALEKAQIAFGMTVVAPQDVSKLLAQGGGRNKAIVKAAGEVYEFSLTIVTEDGKSVGLSSFAEPLTLRLSYDAASDKDLLGVYHVGDDGTLDYVGGHAEEGVFAAEVSHFSKYAVLEYNKTFDDVSDGYWENRVIRTMAAKHVIEGVTDAEFAPEHEVTRAEFAAILVRALELKGSGKSSFADVADSAWYAPYISAASDKGLINGRSQTEFAPEQFVTREEMAAMLMRAYRYLAPSAVSSAQPASFRDRDAISEWAAADVDQASSAGLINGMDEGTFVPQGLTTRAQSAKVIYQLLQSR